MFDALIMALEEQIEIDDVANFCTTGLSLLSGVFVLQNVFPLHCVDQSTKLMRVSSVTSDD